MLPAFLIALREGLEAALIVSILATFLRKTGRAEEIRKVWLGVIAAIVLSLGAGLAMGTGIASLSHKAQEISEGAASLLAVGVLTWMVFFMKRQARAIKGTLEAKATKALAAGTGALVLLAFTAVAREGLETVLFLYATFTSSSAPVSSGGAATLGLLISGLIGYGMYRGAIRINLKRFFQVTGVLVIIVAAGLIAGALHELVEGGLSLPLGAQAWNVSSLISPSGVFGSVLKGLFGYEAKPSVLQVIVYWTYLVPTLLAFFGVPKLKLQRDTNDPESETVRA